MEPHVDLTSGGIPVSFDDLKPGDLRWTLKSTEHSSQKHGPCEVCKGHCSEVFHQWAEVAYWNQEHGRIQFTYHQAPKGLFGHESCLLEARKTAVLREP